MAAGWQALLGDDAARARAEFTKAASRGELAGRVGLIEALLADGAVVEARSACRDALRSGDPTVALLTACGEALTRNGDPLAGFDLYRQAAARVPDRQGIRARAAELRGAALEELLKTARTAVHEKAWKTASDAASRAIELDSTNAGARIAAGDVALAEGERSEALSRYREALRLDGGNRALRERVADIAIEDKDFELAITELDALASEDPAYEARAEEARLSFRVSNWPAPEREAAHAERLTRGDAARLVWWMVPEVREAKVTSGVIASDALNRRDSREVMRAVSLGLLDVDRDTHRARPDSPLTVSAGARLCLRLLRYLNPGPAPACLADHPDGASGGEAIQLARTCGILTAKDRAGVGGPELTRALDRVRAIATGTGVDEKETPQPEPKGTSR